MPKNGAIEPDPKKHTHTVIAKSDFQCDAIEIHIVTGKASKRNGFESIV